MTAQVNKLMMMKLYSKLWQTRVTLILNREALYLDNTWIVDRHDGKRYNMKAQNASLAYQHWHMVVRDTNRIKNEARSNDWI